MTVLSDQDNSVISGNGGSGNSQSRWVGKSAFISHFITHKMKSYSITYSKGTRQKKMTLC